jgi:hypothetical protein
MSCPSIYMVLWYNGIPQCAYILQLVSWWWTLMARDMQMSFCEIKIKTRVHSVALTVITVKKLANTTGQNREQWGSKTSRLYHTIHLRIVQILNMKLLQAGTCQHAHTHTHARTCTHYPTCLHAHNYKKFLLTTLSPDDISILWADATRSRIQQNAIWAVNNSQTFRFPSHMEWQKTNSMGILLYAQYTPMSCIMYTYRYHCYHASKHGSFIVYLDIASHLPC